MGYSGGMDIDVIIFGGGLVGVMFVVVFDVYGIFSVVIDFVDFVVMLVLGFDGCVLVVVSVSYWMFDVIGIG